TQRCTATRIVAEIYFRVTAAPRRVGSIAEVGGAGGHHNRASAAGRKRTCYSCLKLELRVLTDRNRAAIGARRGAAQTETLVAVWVRVTRWREQTNVARSTQYAGDNVFAGISKRLRIGIVNR